jgi:hypothetical protein
VVETLSGTTDVPDEESVKTGPSIAELMEQVAAGHQMT